MSIRHIISTALSIAVIAMTAIFLHSCSEERFTVPDYTISGEEVRLSVPVFIPQMNAETRGGLSEEQLNKVESLWIRTYNAETKEATCDWIKLTPNTTDLHNMREVELTTKSGFSYIVAVANVDCKGVMYDDQDKDNGQPSGDTLEGTDTWMNNVRPLSVLLEKADTWDEFLRIAVVSPYETDDVNAPQAIPMAGCYCDAITVGDKTEHVAYNQWQKKDFQPYFIPASKEMVEFNGGIHLRRLVSHITFNFSAADNIELEVNSYRVMNAPKYSWLYERSAEDTTLPNLGDLAPSAEKAGLYYADVPQFGSQFIKDTQINGKAVQTFNFWQAENKHTGDCSTYRDRGAKAVKDGVTLFTSLTGDTWTPNNEASYVIVDCDVTYKDRIRVNEKGEEVKEGGELVDRSGHATYFIHLGYILGADEAEKAKDFNCFRNVNYTYNVTVNGLDDIRVDAVADTEKYHNEEGLVVDLNANPISLDAHYAVFNIQLTENDLKENFGFIITTYDNGEQITINEDNPRNENGEIFADEEKKHKIEPKYYNWIELRPTTGKDVLALYKPRFNANGTPKPRLNADGTPIEDNNTFLLSDLYVKNGELHIPEGSKSTSGYYTVFVNEYTYEPMFGEERYGDESQTMLHGKPAWMSYVNQNPRRFYIKVSYQESNDGNSVYARSKYAVEQQSLMTYYSQINVDDDGTAVGVERENETLGLNLRHANNAGGSSITNGRWNAAQYLSTGAYHHDYLQQDYDGAWGSISVGRPNEEHRSSWEFFLEMNKPLEVPGVTDHLRLQGGPVIMERTINNGNPHKLRKIKKAGWSKNADEFDPDGEPTTANFTDPQGNNDYTIKAMSALVVRNRDNNGNGKIEAEELRWYIPAITRYVGMTLGENAMPQRLMMFNEITQLPYVNNNNNEFSNDPGRIDNPYYSRYMYLASNAETVDSHSENNVLWAMEGTSMSKYSNLTDWANDNKINPWQIRCVRNLGSDLRTVKKEDKVMLPYKHISATRTISMDYFNLAAIRTTAYTSNGKTESTTSGIMPVHTINSPYNSVYTAFEYADHDIIVPDDDKPSFSDFEDHYFDKLTDYIEKNPCGNANLTGSGWRVPNQIEITMMFNSGILDVDGNWLTCTVDYFDREDGKGSDNIAHKLYMGATKDKTLLLSWDNYNSSFNLRVRCVRDVPH